MPFKAASFYYLSIKNSHTDLL